MEYNEIYHHGIKGMRWGVRRYQNPDGSLTPAGKKRQRDNSPEAVARRKEIAKKVAVGTTVAVVGAYSITMLSGAAALYAKNPAVRNVVNSMAKSSVADLKAGKGKAINAGKTFVKQSITGVKEGFKEGAKEAPKKAAKAVITGIALNTTKRMLDSAVGKAEAERIFKANNNKKIDSFWKVREEDDD